MFSRACLCVFLCVFLCVVSACVYEFTLVFMSVYYAYVCVPFGVYEHLCHPYV